MKSIYFICFLTQSHVQAKYFINNNIFKKIEQYISHGRITRIWDNFFLIAYGYAINELLGSEKI